VGYIACRPVVIIKSGEKRKVQHNKKYLKPTYQSTDECCLLQVFKSTTIYNGLFRPSLCDPYAVH
jgi:hypothetical protein